MQKRITLLLATILTTSLPSINLFAATNSDNKSSMQQACEKLGTKSYEQTADSPAVIIKASYVTNAEESLERQFMFGKRSIVQGMPIGENVKELPAHCRIEGYFAPAVKFLALLPDAKSWNDDVIYKSCDAFCGAVQEDMPIAGLVKGFASITTDGGHINKRPFDGTWGYNNREGEIDFGYRASHLAAQLIKQLSLDYYGKAHQYAYITGFSKGGLAGIKSALMYPKDYDGILARSPVVRYQDINAIRLPYLYRANTRPDGSPILLAADALFIHNAAVKSCDAVDGLTDGIIDDPTACQFDPSELLCKKGQSTECLTAEQVTTTKKFYALPTNDNGDVTYPYPLAVGSELDWMGFHTPFTINDESYSKSIASSYIRYMAFDHDPGAFYDWTSFDPIKEGYKLKPMSAVYDANDPDLTEFYKSGGKMIVVHGLADGAVNAQMTIDWFNNVKKLMGDDTGKFVQLYTAPGTKHGGGPSDGPNINESLTALQEWVEEDKAPKQLIFRSENDKGQVTRTRPYYPYPLKTEYIGKGSIDKASNFKPVMR